MTDKDRAERIREEILQAKKFAGINPPRLVPRGNAFRSATSSRPFGAVAHELDLPQLRGVLNDDVIATGPEPAELPSSFLEKVAMPSRAMLAQVEIALEQLDTDRVSPKLREAVADQLNMLGAINADDKSLDVLRERFDALRFGQVKFKDQDDLPGGSAPSE